MRTLRSRCAAVACLLAAGQAQAQTPISESELLDALSADTTLNTLVESPVNRAEAARQEAALVHAPTLAVSREDAGEGFIEWTWSARWTPPTPGRRSLAIRRAEVHLQAAESASQEEHLRLRGDLRAAYAEWAVAHGRSVSAAELAADLGELARFVEARAEAGESAGTSARRLNLAARRAAASAAREEAEIARARGRVEALVGLLPEDALPVLSPLPPLPDAPPMANEHPTLLAARSEQEAGELALKLARRLLELPEIELGWRELRESQDTTSGPVIGLSWRLPLPSHRRAAVAAATAEHEGAHARRTLQEQEFHAAAQAHTTAFTTLRRAAAEAPTDDPGLRHAVTLAFRLGELPLTDLLDTLEALHAATLDRLAFHAAALEAHRELEFATGRPLELTP